MADALDFRTLMVVLALLYFCEAAGLIYVWRTHLNYTPSRNWALGSVLIAVGTLFVAARGQFSGAAAIIAGNLCICTGILVYASGVVQASERKAPWRSGAALLCAYLLAITWFTIWVPSLETRILLFGCFTAVCLGFAAACALRAPPGPLRLTLSLIAALLALQAGTALMRGIAAMQFGATLFQASTSQLVFIFSNIASSFLLAVLFATLTSQRVTALLVEARTLAERAAAVKSDFLANMSHEIRTPLNSIVGFAGLLKASDALNARDRRYVEVVGDAGRSLLTIVNDVLDFSSLDSGAFKLHAKPFALRVLIEHVAEGFLPLTTEKGLSLDVRVQGAPAPAHVGDDTRIRQVLINLIGNAIKFTAKGGVSVTLEAAPPTGGRQRLRIEVRDTGIGIAPAKLPALFTRFTQADGSINRRFGGSGLGLAISKRLVEHMDGRIGVDSMEGAGSMFWFVLDLACAPQSALGEAAADQSSVRETSLRRILVVDDVDLNRELVIALLAPHGHDIDQAADGAEAIRAVERKAFDLVLMDVQMPGIDGLAAARTIRALPQCSRLPIVAMTAQALPEQIDACRKAGMDDYVAKPIVPTALFAAVEKWTDRTAPAKPAGPEISLPDDVTLELRAKFIERCAVDLAEIHALMSSKSAATRGDLHKLIHRCAGAAGTLGFAEIGACAGDLDQAFARGDDPPDADVARFAAVLDAAVKAA
jgi:signal transduction histidine kinase/CheY-like chemotaxis protein/HPt (histidine-containing phosphotransfer) domain-containing protein